MFCSAQNFRHGNGQYGCSRTEKEPPDSLPCCLFIQVIQRLLVRLMNQTELVNAIAKELDIPRTHSQQLLRATLQEISDLLKNGEAVTIPQWGTFDTAIHEPRRGFLPLGFLPLGQGYAIFPRRRVPVFRTGTFLHDGVYDLEYIEEEVAA